MISGCNCNACAIRRAPKIHKCLISTCAPQPYGDKSRAKQKQANSSKQDGGILTLMLHTYTGKNRCARAIVPPLAGRPCSEQDFTYGQSTPRPVRACAQSRPRRKRTLARFSSTLVCNIRVINIPGAKMNARGLIHEVDSFCCCDLLDCLGYLGQPLSRSSP
jgi:hypothetical protein